MNTIKATALQPGDTIGIAAPAGIVDPARLRRGIAYVESLGLKVVVGPHVLKKALYFAGAHAQRLADLNDMIRNPRVKAIFCARGGYGSVHLLAALDYASLRRSPKIFMGASDITVLLNTIFARTGLITFHGPMVMTNFSKGEQGIDEDSLRRNLFRASAKREAKSWSMDLDRRRVLRRGKAAGRLVGGCLSLLISTLGTPYEIDTRGAILFLEDVNEPLYRIDRMLKQLEDAGKLSTVRGIVFGDMVNCGDSKLAGWTARKVVSDFLAAFEGPSVMGLSSGHTRNPFVTLPIGARATLDTRARPRLAIEESTTV